MKKKAALAVIQSGASYNLFENKMMKSFLTDLLTEGNNLSYAAKQKLLEDLSNRDQVKKDVEELGFAFRTVCLSRIRLDTLILIDKY